ncbi:unnamed protein product [Aphanomyces euteiches]|uniref:DUF1295 domain-containing protein n=1 Tax=Aphanomyces euteiches TaxID=100861 RepID=A0A6G0W6I2_9STRA|nr:hypothetical protein Ae201684_018244 [Aphanomyces euteiches]KAH9068534.1 hypothetical protein Ae201684P_004240 [Aphanomyces euteiches]KAH9126692.1 hypothetical protein AeMF1_002894 [Aphanomyces euteiches]KAH9153242.1 hypothetical protein AeRB84_004468 [Aphanomyces euteiches]KAH9163260.1 hypothetical protein LEN26_000585 [Aphanomyces euteiches]
MGLGQDIAGIVFSVGTVLAIALPMNLGVYAAAAFGVNWLSALLYAIPRQSEKFYDLTGSITFIVLAILGVMLHFDTLNWRSLNASVLVLVWACRLGGFLFARIHASGVDRRFKFIRSAPVTFFMAWTMQGLWNFATILPVLLIHASSPSASPSIVYSDILGLGLWILGFSVEVIADSQKWAFRKTNPDRFITSGL